MLARFELKEFRMTHGRGLEILRHEIVVSEEVVNAPEHEICVGGREEVSMQIDGFHGCNFGANHFFDFVGRDENRGLGLKCVEDVHCFLTIQHALQQSTSLDH